MHVEHHAARMVAYFSFWSRGGVVKDNACGIHGFCCCVSLLAGYVSQSNQHGIVKGQGVLKENTDNCLDMDEVGWGGGAYCTLAL